MDHERRRGRLANIFAPLLEALSPARCMTCLIEGKWLCSDCRQAPCFFRQQCIQCSKDNLRGLTCPTCQAQTPLTGVLSADAYRRPAITRGIEWLKYKGIREVAPVLAALLVERLSLIAPLEVLQSQAVFVPIPLHAWRERRRGFNQSKEIAEALSRETGIPVTAVLRRKRYTLAQVTLPPELRLSNLQDAFEVADQDEPAPITILVDDVTTTGSTLSAAARVLKMAGADEIWGVTIARG